MPLSLLRALEWISFRHACLPKEVIVFRGILIVLHRDFSTVVAHAVSADDAGVVEGLRSMKRNPQEAKLLETDLFGVVGCDRGRLHEKGLIEFCVEVEQGNAGFRGNPDGLKAIKWLAGSQRWAHSFCVMFEDISSGSSWIRADY